MIKRIIGVVLALAGFGFTVQSQNVKQVTLVNFNLQSSALVPNSGEELSSSKYHLNQHWYAVKVPSTVLTGLVANKVYPSPYFGLNNMQIPDASDEFNKKYDLDKFSFLPGKANPWKRPYWYRTLFMVPEADKGKTFQLIFKGINYRAAVWLNGKQIADSTQMAGIFAEYNLDVSKQIIPGKQNILAVKIYPLDYPGLPAQEQLKALGPFFENGGPTGDIGKNVTMLCSVGWDWMPPVRDRNMGIWQPVYLRTTGTVTIGKPQIKSELPNLPDTNIAKLSLALMLTNHGITTQKGRLKVSIIPENFKSVLAIKFEKKVAVGPSSSAKVEFDAANVSQLLINNPHLWWPNNYGRANLYRIRMQYINKAGIADDTSFVFGIRTTTTSTSNVNGFLRRDFFVNGQKVHLVGGAWVPDMMVNRDSVRFDHELHLCKNANVNLVRIWGGGITPPDAFFNAADKYGLMVWSDFWITGDTQGEFKGSPDWPLESNVFIRNVTSTIYRIRNHPSLLVWTGGNEGHARKELYDAMRNNIIELDGTRPFIPSSSGFAKLPEGWKGSWPDDKASGVYSGGPYSWQDPHQYYKLADAGRDWVFKDETGIPSQPPYTTLARIVSDPSLDKNLPFPLNNTWGYHDAATGAGKYDLYYQQMARRYGKPESVEDFANKMQLLNAIGYQGIFEAANHKLNETGGVMLWKLNAALPSVIWQVYDWYLEPNAGYYFMQNACEPIHVQMNLDDSVATIVNRTHRPTSALTVHAQVFDINSKKIYDKVTSTSLETTGTKELDHLASTLKYVKGTSFVILNVKDAAGKSISHNAYWLAPDTNYTDLKNMPKARLKLTLVKTELLGREVKQTLHIVNQSDKVAFFVRPQLMSNNDEVMPSYWSANYFTLAPFEDITVSVSAAPLPNSTKTLISVSGWNVPSQQIILGDK
ncbi:glycoside hydrolase family 2 TIM barrel-domain containing protein [uncultured Mucilaginibacter sp.]|uniref:glycoside hydrolase family 2 protein n=1 Tax=uncultured Mucilaginibacter sp. TaxID=797541 RepID=UPI0025EC2D53|nr:glycoside hydrolase family 2 TIM barrel-domain containing protein [uncultured Mucilaginibacter sp.]